MADEDKDPNDFVLNDAINSLYSKAKTDVDAPWKKKLIIGSVVGLALIIVLIVVLVVVRSKNNEDNGNNNNNDITEDIIAEIDCVYIINDITKSTIILGKEFEKGSNSFDIYIGKDKIKYTKEYQFKQEGRIDVSFKIYSPINMDYMFKDVTTLNSALLISNKNAEITSMKSTFENCVVLSSVTISGFNTKNIKSVSRLFSNTNIAILSLSDFSTSKIEDFSYMFSGIPKETLDLSKFDTSNAKNMSHMFYKSIYIK